MEIGVYRPIFNHKNIKGSMVQRYPYLTIWENNILSILHFLELDTFYYYFFDHQDTESD